MPCTVCAHTHARRVCTHGQGVCMPVAVSPCPGVSGTAWPSLVIHRCCRHVPLGRGLPGRGAVCPPPPYHITAPGTPAEGRGLGKWATAAHTNSYLGQYSISPISPRFFPLPSPMRDDCGGAQRGVLEVRKHPPAPVGQPLRPYHQLPPSRTPARPSQPFSAKGHIPSRVPHPAPPQPCCTPPGPDIEDSSFLPAPLPLVRCCWPVVLPGSHRVAAVGGLRPPRAAPPPGHMPCPARAPQSTQAGGGAGAPWTPHPSSSKPSSWPVPVAPCAG